MQTSSAATAENQAAERSARLNKTFAYYFAFVVLGLAASTFGPTLTGLAGHTRSTIGQISALFVMRSLGYLVGSLLAGRLYDRMRGHRLMVGAILLMVVCMALVPVVPLLVLLGAVILVLGAAEGLLDVGGNTLLVWVHRDQMGPFMNGLHFFFGLGAFFSPIIIAQAVLWTGDIYWAYWALAILMLPAAFWLWRMPSPSPIVTADKSAERPALPSLILLIAVFDFLYVGAEVSYGGWVSTYAIGMNLATQVTAAYLASGFWGALTAGRLAGIPIAARFSPQVIMLIDLLIVLASLLVAVLFPGSLLALWVSTIGVGAGMASIFPTMLTLAERHMTVTGNVTSWFFVGSSLGGMVLPYIIGRLYETTGPRAAMVSITTSIALSLLIFGGLLLYLRKLGR